MARPISDEELQLKRRARRRLIGAIVLVAAIVVALPMVLDSEPKPISGEVSIKIPSPDSGAFTSRVVPVAPDGESKAAPAPRLSTELKSAPKVAVAPPEKKAVAPVPAPAPPEQKAAPVPAPAEKKAAPAAAAPAPAKAATAADSEAPAKAAQAPPRKPAAAEPPGQTFAVQVVALADPEKAKQMQTQVAAAGVKSYTEVVKTVKGNVTRVRAGPFSTRAAAEKALAQLKAAGLSGNVVPK